LPLSVLADQLRGINWESSFTLRLLIGLTALLPVLPSGPSHLLFLFYIFESVTVQDPAHHPLLPLLALPADCYLAPYVAQLIQPDGLARLGKMTIQELTLALPLPEPARELTPTPPKGPVLTALQLEGSAPLPVDYTNFDLLRPLPSFLPLSPCELAWLSPSSRQQPLLESL
jgi:hypothetical protein